MAVSSSSILALLQRNAEACAEAKHQKCRCRCRGIYHGKQHPAEWIAEQEAEIEMTLDYLAGADCG